MYTLTTENQSILKARKIGHVLDKLLRESVMFFNQEMMLILI